MKRITIVLFSASVALFLISLTTLLPETSAAAPTKIVEVFGMVDVGNLPVDGSGALRVSAETSPPVNFQVFTVPVATVDGVNFISEVFPTAGWRSLSAVPVIRDLNTGALTVIFADSILFRHTPVSPFFGVAGDPINSVMGTEAKVQRAVGFPQEVVEFTVYLSR